LAGAQDHVLGAVRDVQVTVLVEEADIARVQPAVTDRLGCCVGPVPVARRDRRAAQADLDRKSTRLNSSHSQIPYAVFCVKKKNAAEKRFTTVFGTNGVLLPAREARLIRDHRVLGASISLDSPDPGRHEALRHVAGAWDGAGSATRALADEGIDFSLHLSVTDCNVGEVPAMIDLAKELGAKVLNFFFFVGTATAGIYTLSLHDALPI